MKATVFGGANHRASVRVPGDKSISHRALLFSLISNGTSRITGLSGADDVAATATAVSQLGAKVLQEGHVVVVRGVGGELCEPEQLINVGNSGTLLRLICGILAPCVGNSYFITGDASIVRRPMARVIQPLSAMGALIMGRQSNQFAPLAIQGRELSGITYSMSTPSAQVKSAILFAGLFADGETAVIEPTATRAHTEEMALGYGADIEVEFDSGPRVIRVRRSSLVARDFEVAGDPSAAAFFVVLGLIGHASVSVENVYLGPQRDGFIEVLTRMGGRIETSHQENGNFTVTAFPSTLHAVDIGPSGIPGLIDEVPILAVAASRAKGTTRFLGVEELRFKESDRIRTTVSMLAEFGVACREIADGFEVSGVRSPEHHHVHRQVESFYDHRIAMSAAILATLHKGRTEISQFESVATSFPGFLDRLRECGIKASLGERQLGPFHR